MCVCVFSAPGSRGDLLTRGQRVRSLECAPLLSIGPDGDWHSHLTWKAALSPEACYALLSVCACVWRRHSQSGTAEIQRKNSGTHLPGSQVHTKATYQFWLRVASPLQSWVRAAGLFSTPPHCLAGHMVWLGQNESTALGITVAHPSRWCVGECELNADSRVYHS